MGSAGGWTNYLTIDALGRVTKVEQKAADQAVKRLEYTYATNGFVKTMKYPSGLVVTQEQSGAGRTKSVVGSNGVTYAGGVTYGAGGMMTLVNLNVSGANRLEEKRSYNALGQMTMQDVRKGGVDSGRLWKVSNDYGTSENNGNLLKQWTETGSATYGVKFAYDAANRIRGAAENAPGEGSLESSPCSTVRGTWCVKYQVDAFGNAWTENKSGTAGGLLPSSSSWFTASNRLNNVAYYANGNQKQWVVNDALSRAEFDAEGRMVKAGRTLTAGGTDWDVSQPIVTMTYNGLGQRVKKLVQQSGVADAVSYWVYGLDGEMVAEWESGSVMSGRQFLVSDQLGSTRVRLDASGEVLQRVDYEPYGGEVQRNGVSGYGGGNEVRVKYTGQMRDPEVGADFYNARYLGLGLGRFTSPDEPLIYADPGNPQSWNLYSYALSNPMLYSDPDGHEPCVDGVNPENGNLCVVGTARRPLVDVATSGMGNLFLQTIVFTSKVVQETQQLIRPVSDWLNQPRNPLCTAGFQSIGMTVGFWAGGGLGSLGLAGGPAGGFTMPAGAMGGSMLGGVVGGFGSLVFCSTGSGGTGGGSFKNSKPGLSGKEAATDVPSWARGQKPLAGESGKKFAERILNEKYGPGNYPKGPGSEFSKIQKWGDRAFE